MIPLIKIIKYRCIYKCYFYYWWTYKYSDQFLVGGGSTQYTGLGAILSEGTIAFGIANTIEVFYIWNLILIWLGLQITAGLSKGKATIPIIILSIMKVTFLTAIMMLITSFLPGVPM